MGGRRAARDGRDFQPPAGDLRDSPKTGGPERRRDGELERWRPSAAGVLRAPERRRSGPGRHRGDDGHRRLQSLTTPTLVSDSQRGGAAADGSRRFVLLLGIPIALLQLLAALLPSPVTSRQRLLASGQKEARRRTWRCSVLPVPREEKQERTRTREREEGSRADGSERASEGGNRTTRRGGAEDAEGAHRETRQHQEVKEQQEETEKKRTEI